MAQMLAMAVNDLGNNWDKQHADVEFSYNNSVSATKGLAPNEVHMSRLPRLPLTIFERAGVAGHKILARDHLAYRDLARRAARNPRTISFAITPPLTLLA